MLARAHEVQKDTLQDVVPKYIWKLWSSHQSKIKCSPFQIHFKRKANTVGKQLVSGKLVSGILDKGKLILSKKRTKDWSADDRVEDEYKVTLIAKKNQTPVEKGCESDDPFPSEQSSSRMPLQIQFKGKILQKTNESIKGNPFDKELNQKKS